jgi:hypothetical protein
VDDSVDRSVADEVTGAPALRQEVERKFWREVGRLTSEDAAAAVGVSPAADTRWFRQRSGMPSFMLTR